MGGKMRLYRFIERQSGTIHWVAGKDVNSAKSFALEIANFPFDENDDEYIISEELEYVPISPSEKFTFFKDQNAIEHTAKDWETIFSLHKSTTYIACSEY